MGRNFCLSLPLALLIAVAPAAAASVTSASVQPAESAQLAPLVSPQPSRQSGQHGTATGSPTAACAKSFLAHLQCWREQAQAATGKGKPYEVTLKQPLGLDDPAAQTDWQGYRNAFRQNPLVVSIPSGRQSGAGGTALLILVGQGQRRVAPDSMITTLSSQAVQSMGAVCQQDSLCAMVNSGIGQGTIPGQRLLDSGLAAALPPSTKTTKTTRSTKPTEAANDQPGRSPAHTFFYVLLVLLFALAGVAVLVSPKLRLAIGETVKPRTAPPPASSRQPRPQQRPEQPAEPGDRSQRGSRYGRQTAIPPGPRRTAIIRSDLHPQGYVEVDRCLFRAVWASPQAPAPGLGASVDVVQGVGPDSDILLALPPGTPN